MKTLIRDPFFLIGIVVRLALIGLVLPAPVSNWYVPFLGSSLGAPGFDPWGTWQQVGGAPEAFPYGYVMWFAFLPLTLLCKLVGLPLAFGYGLTLVVADFVILALLRRLLPNRDKALVLAYWLSPIVLVASYYLGFNDLVPVAFLSLALYLVRQTRFFGAGVACIAAVSAKFSMVLALPFFLIYLLHNRPVRRFLPAFLRGAGIAAAVLLVPFLLLSPTGVAMMFGNPEMAKVYRFTVQLGDSLAVYLVPLAYLIMLYATWRVRRINFDLFGTMLGMAFLLVVLMTPASPGWFIWALPLLVGYQLTSDRVAKVMVTLFSVLYAISSLMLAVPGTEVWWVANVPVGLPGGYQQLNSVVHTVMIAVGIVLAVRIWRESISRNDFFRLSRKPFVLGVAGDSGAGKDTFSDAIRDLFGSHSVATLSGDDYHLWDRQKPMWQVMTHLNPMANDLESFSSDLVSLTDGRTIQSRHYDHQTGRMSRPFTIRSNDIIIASGLHALYLPILRQCYNLSIYLDIDEDLRRYFKIERDVKKRGHTLERVLNSFEKREPDSQTFIRPQASYADLVLSLQPIHPRMLDGTTHNGTLRYKLVVKSRHGMNELSLTRVLIGVCGLHVDMTTRRDFSEVELTIEGETTGEDIALAAKMVCPGIFGFLDIEPKWQDGALGLMQLITLSHIDQALTRRFIW